jgi:hypothetical protein
MIKNSFGNYVIQKALKVAVGEVKQKLLIAVRKNIEFLNDRKIIKKWKSILNAIGNESESDPDRKMNN